MIRLAFYIRDSQEIGGTCLRSQKPSGALAESNKDTSTKAKEVSTLRGPAQLADLQGTLCVPAQYSYTTVIASSIQNQWKSTIKYRQSVSQNTSV